MSHFSLPAGYDSPFLAILVGALLLAFGRRLFWLVVGLLGFVVGWTFSFGYFEFAEPWQGFAVALGCGVIASGLAVLLPKIAMGLAGFLGGGYFGLWVLERYVSNPADWMWLLVVAAGIAGAILAVKVLDLGLVAVTAAVGSSLVVDAVQVEGTVGTALFLLLAVGGVALQMMRATKKA